MQRSPLWLGLAVWVLSILAGPCATGQVKDHQALQGNATQDPSRKLRAMRIGAPIRHALREQVNSGLVTIIFAGLDHDDLSDATDLIDSLGEANLRILPVAGEGAKQNATDLLFARGIDIGIVPTDVLASLKRQPPFPGIEGFLQYITKLYDEEIHILAGSDIRSLEDLTSKTVNFGTTGSGTYLTASTIFEALGISVQVTSFPQPLALDKLRRGEISALVYTVGKPARLFQAIRPDEALHFLSIPAGALGGSYKQADLSTEDYPNLIEESKPVATLAVGTVLAVYNWPIGSERYRKVAHFVEAFFGHFEELRKPPHHPKWREVDVGASVAGWTRFGPASQWIKSAKRDKGERVRSAGLGSTVEIGTTTPAQMLSAGSGDVDPSSLGLAIDQTKRMSADGAKEKSPQPSAAASRQAPGAEVSNAISLDNSRLDALFTEFLEYQKQEARKSRDDPSQIETLFAEFQAYEKRLLQRRNGQPPAAKGKLSVVQLSGKPARRSPTLSVSACNAQC
jgi:uncharacterized protein